MKCIETLESRLFLSASTLSTDEATLHTNITSLVTFGESSLATIRTDVAGQTLTKADKALAGAWVKTTNARYKKLLNADTAGAKAVNKAVAKLDAAPSSKVAADAAKLQAVAAKALSAVTADINALQAADSTGLTRISNALPNDTQLQTDLGTIEANGTTLITTIQAGATTVFSTDVSVTG